MQPQEPVNPYASPQVEMAVEQADDRSLLDLSGMRTTGIGLSLVYYGIVLLLLTLILSIPITFVIGPTENVGLVLIGFGAMTFIAGVMMFVGQIVCLAVPVQTGARAYIIVTVLLQVGGFLQALLQVIEQYAPQVQVPLPLMLLLNLLSALSIVFFVLFLRELSLSIRRNDLARRAITILILGAVVFVFAIVWIFGPMIAAFYTTLVPTGPGAWLLGGPLLAIGALICFVMYANLINAVRKVLLRRRSLAA